MAHLSKRAKELGTRIVARSRAVWAQPGKNPTAGRGTGYFPYCLAACPIDGPAVARSCEFMTGRSETFAPNARNHGSATDGICDASFMSNTMDPDRWPSSSAKK